MIGSEDERVNQDVGTPREGYAALVFGNARSDMTPSPEGPRTEAGRRLLAMDNFDTAALDDDAVLGIVLAIEAEARTAALSEVEVAVREMRAFEHDGDFVREARDGFPELHYVNRSGVLFRIASLRDKETAK